MQISRSRSKQKKLLSAQSGSSNVALSPNETDDRQTSHFSASTSGQERLSGGKNVSAANDQPVKESLSQKSATALVKKESDVQGSAGSAGSSGSAQYWQVGPYHSRILFTENILESRLVFVQRDYICRHLIVV